MPDPHPASWLIPYRDRIVVIDLDEHYLVIGTVDEVDAWHVTLRDADLHDHRDANCTKEVYVLEARNLGITVNRKRVAIPVARIIAVSHLEDLGP